jgi:hypothetical protein
VSKCNSSSQKLLLTTGIWTRNLWLRSLDLRPLDQPAINYVCMYVMYEYMFEDLTELKLSNVCKGRWPKIYYLELLRASESTAFAVVNPPVVVGYVPFFLCVIHKEGLCSSCWDI